MWEVTVRAVNAPSSLKKILIVVLTVFHDYGRGGQPVVHVPQVAEAASWCGTWQIVEETGSTATEQAESKKEDSRLGPGRELEWHLGRSNFCSKMDLWCVFQKDGPHWPSALY